MAKIDIGEDKNELSPEDKPVAKSLSMYLEDLPKTQEEAIAEVRKNIWMQWLNSEPLISAHVEDDGKTSLFFISEELKNKIVLLDICDFTLLPCRRALRYVKEWHRRYQSAGLVVIAVHTPFFEFCKDRNAVQAMLHAMDVSYPVVMDNDFLIWRSIDNRFWPRRILLDETGKTQADFVGEGAYPDFEKIMQDRLRTLSPGLACPPLLKPMRDVDVEGGEVAKTTPEIFFGSIRKIEFGNATFPTRINEEFLFPEEKLFGSKEDVPYFQGAWAIQKDHISVYAPIDPKKAHKGENSLTIRFTGTDVFIVAKTKPKIWGDPPQSVKLFISVDGKLLSEENFGSDAVVGDTYRPQVIVRDPRLFHIVTKLEYGTHLFSIQIDPEGPDTAEIYAVFFDSVV